MRSLDIRLVGFIAALAVGAGSLVVIAYPNRDQTKGPPGGRTDAAVVPSHFTKMTPTASIQGSPPTAWGVEARRIDGVGNNVANPMWGTAGRNLLRVAPVAYGDGVSSPAGADRPNPRMISSTVTAQTGSIPNPFGATDYMWQWGQFLDHDLDLVPIPEADIESLPIPVPMGDPEFDPMGTGTQELPLTRSAFDAATGTGPGNPRQQFNLLTAYIDASNVYGSDIVRADWLRTMDGTGRLKTSAGDLPPYNTAGLPNAGGTSPDLFLAGDVRINEQLGLTSIHTLFVREHNRLAAEILAAEPGLSDEEVYQRARAIVGAQMQVITYKEFLPVLLGPGALPAYAGYDAGVDASVITEFASACYRLGHTMLSGTILRRAADGSAIPEGNLPLREAFFVPSKLVDEGGIDPILRGLASQRMQRIDSFVVDDVRNFLFGPPGAGGMDLISLNIQRARDHGLPTYNQIRQAFGLPAVTGFADITSDPLRQSRLQTAYGDVDKIDLWVGAVSEDPVAGGMVGETLRTVLVDQFRRARDGDRFWYQNFFSGALLAELEDTRLSDILRRNTAIGSELQDNVFLMPNFGVPAASHWGMAAMSLLLLAAGTVALRRTGQRHSA